MRGRIEKALSGFYYVKAEDGKAYACKPRGIFRKEDALSPLVGDVVSMEVTDQKDMEGVIDTIHPRKNVLMRPPIANVDGALIVFAVKEPAPHKMLLDRFLVCMEYYHIPAILCFNKLDLDTDASGKELFSVYEKAGYTCVGISTKTKEGIDTLKEKLQDNCFVICGPSGVGKSSLINCLSGNLLAKTGAVSKKIKRGKQTTRHTELLEVWSNTFIADTPGFGSIYVPDMEKESLANCFPEFRSFLSECRFSGCSHLHEPDCGVRAHLDTICESRYEHYGAMYRELSEKSRF